jgi:hypothetical protein
VLAYVAAFQMARRYSQECLSPFRLAPACESRYKIKAANLAICFLGFSVHRGREYYVRSAELGMLGSIFDLVSDGLQFDHAAVERFERLARRTLDAESARISLDTLERKKYGGFEFDGLSRGIPALRIILKHLKSESFWPNDDDIVEVGLLCQIADDLIDCRDDFAKNELNFLKQKDWLSHAKRLLDWNYEKQLSKSQYPLVLFHVFKRAKVQAAKLANGALPDFPLVGPGLANGSGLTFPNRFGGRTPKTEPAAMRRVF